MNKPIKIILIDDAKDITDVIRLVLELDGFIVETYSDGKLALARLNESSKMCLILLDLQMPGLSGYEFMERFKKSGKFPVPVYLFSASEEAEAMAKVCGAEGVIKKPVGLEYLLGVVNNHCPGTIQSSPH